MMELFPSVVAHLGDFDIVVCRDTGDGDEQAADVDGGEWIVEDDACCGDGDDFFEDAADAEGDDGGALQEGEFGRGH